MPGAWARAGDLAGFAAAIPGAAFVAELSRPPSGLTVVTCVGERVPLTYLENAFPVHDAGRTTTARNLVLAVPDVVTDVLAYHGAGDEYYVGRVPVPPVPSTPRPASPPECGAPTAAPRVVSRRTLRRPPRWAAVARRRLWGPDHRCSAD